MERLTSAELKRIVDVVAACYRASGVDAYKSRDRRCDPACAPHDHGELQRVRLRQARRAVGRRAGRVAALPERRGDLRAAVGLAFSWKTRDFTERDRLVLTVLQPHLVTAYANARAFSRLEGDLALLDRGLDALEAAIVVLGPGRRIVTAMATARRYLGKYFGRGAGQRLPEALASWHARVAASAADPTAPPIPIFVHRLADAELRVRVLENAGRTCLLLEERRERPPLERGIEAGLTPREAEVLR